MSDISTQSPDDGFNYLMLSDVHLGSDIIPHLRPWALTSWLLEENEVDARLVALLEHYSSWRSQGRPWRLVIAGDFLDLVGVSLAPPSNLRTPPTKEEQRHGLGSAPDHVVRKVQAIVARHPTVFRALGRFVAAGNALVIVRGNHDIELYWRAAQRALIEAVVASQPARQRALLRSRIDIRRWFFAVEGLLYVEHGHEFDAMCSYGDPLVSTSLRDRNRIRWTPFSVLLRYVARPTRGLSSAGYGYVGMGAYVGLLLKLGLRGSIGIAGRYLRASYCLLSECIHNTRAVAKSRTQAARAGLRRFARASGVREERLRGLCSLYVAPAVHRFSFMMRSLYLDRIVCGLSAAFGFALAALLLAYSGLLSALSSALPAALFLGYAVVGSGKNSSPQATMIHNAPHIAEMFSARWVIMGHTHQPVVQPVSPHASYVNLGSGGEDDPPDERITDRDGMSTFLVIQKEQGDFRAALLRWDDVKGPVPISYQPDTQSPPPRAARNSGLSMPAI